MFSLNITSTDKKLLERVKEYAKSIGCFSSGIVEEKVIDIEREEEVAEDNIPFSRRDTTPYELYGIMRNGELGYIGRTCVGAAQRISRHLKRGEDALEPYVQWMAEGLEKRDIEAGVIKKVTGYREAKSEETRLRRILKPRFNKQDSEYGLVRKIGGLKPLDRLLGIDMQDQS